MLPFSIIVAVDKNFGIGKNGQMPWQLSADLKRFKEITTRTNSENKKNVVIMGRNTWDSIPDRFKPLRNRINIVISRNKELKLSEGVFLADSLDSAFSLIENKLSDVIGEVFVIGGGQLYSEAVSKSEFKNLYITRILEKYDCDTFFSIDLLRFKNIFTSSVKKEGKLSYFFEEYANLQ